MNSQFVRFGAMGYVGRFRSSDGSIFRRTARVILRTSRGTEIGEVISDPSSALRDESAGGDERPTVAVPSAERSPHFDGEILRGMTVEDELLQARLEKHRSDAYAACLKLLETRHLPVTLVDVEHLFDGENLIFHFLGAIPPEVHEMTAELSQAYEAKAQLAQFAETLAAGCGPDCGTESAAGCDSCVSCLWPLHARARTAVPRPLQRVFRFAGPQTFTDRAKSNNPQIRLNASDRNSRYSLDRRGCIAPEWPRSTCAGTRLG